MLGKHEQLLCLYSEHWKDWKPGKQKNGGIFAASRCWFWRLNQLSDHRRERGKVGRDWRAQ